MTITKLAFPFTEDATEQFSMTAVLSTVTIECLFKFIDSVWRMFARMPDGSIREAGVFPNSVNWAGFSDYRVVFSTDKTSIGLTDLASVEIFILDING